MTITATSRLKTLAVAFATVAPIVAGVTVMSAGTAAASCRPGGLAAGEYVSSNDALSRIEISFAPNGCTRLLEAYSTCEDDPTSDCSWGQEILNKSGDGTYSYAYYEWENANETISIIASDQTAIYVRDYTVWGDGEVTDVKVTLEQA